MKFIKWLKKLINLVNEYEKEISFLEKRIESAEKIIRDRTDINVDINRRKHENQIIVIGKYRNIDYIQTFTVDSRDFSYTIDMLKKMDRYGTLNKVDSAPDIKAVFKNELGML